MPVDSDTRRQWHRRGTPTRWGRYRPSKIDVRASDESDRATALFEMKGGADIGCRVWVAGGRRMLRSQMDVEFDCDAWTTGIPNNRDRRC